MKRRSQANRLLLLLGMAMTLAVIAAWAGGRLDWLEFRLLDLRFSSPLVNPVRPSPRITCVNISDQAIDLVGRWPWSRVDQAGLLAVMAELGAAAALVDLTYVEGETPQLPLAPDSGLSRTLEDALSARGAPQFPDRELECALRQAANVYLAFHHPPADIERSAVFDRAVSAFAAGDATSGVRLLERADATWERACAAGDPAALPLPSPSTRARLAALLSANPRWSDDELVEASGLAEDARRGFPRAQEAALRRVVRSWLAADPARAALDSGEGWLQLHADVTGRDAPNESGLTRGLRRAYIEVLGYAATTDRPVIPLERAAPAAPEIDGFAPVFFPHARAAEGCGFVNFDPDLDGAVRRLRLFAQHDGRLLVQLAFVVGWRALKMTPDRLIVAPSRVTLRGAGVQQSDLVIPLDARGHAVLPWIPATGPSRFREVDARDVWLIWQRRELVRRNHVILLAGLHELLSAEAFIDYFDERELVEAAHSATLARMRALLAGDAAGVAAATQAAAGTVDRLLERWPAIRAQLDRLTTEVPDGAARVEARAQIEQVISANARLMGEVAESVERLRPMLDGQVCLLGYTATSLADQVRTPVDPRAPGVLAHANLLNGLLTGRWVQLAPPWLTALMTLACGLAATVSAVHLRGREATLVMLAAGALLVLVGGWAAFRFGLLWVWLAPPLTALLLTFFVIIVVRYIFVDRERRELATALGQYTSRQIARLVSENAELCRRAEMREVSAMFTDLRGFTSISERIGAQRTQQVLNKLLGGSTEVILRHEGMLNKFMGDGVFAFWNPVIYPQEDHARRACAAALDLIAALAALRPERTQTGETIYAELAMRIGIATGNAIVGPCGSEQKFDYTCIGDSVNLAARLESANKFYGTAILVSAATRQQAGDEFAFRPLGAVQVKGKREAVQIYELLGRRSDATPEQVAYSESFGSAVELFRARRWEEARTAFALCGRMRDDDPAAQVYAEAIERFRIEPPPEDWNTALELTEK